ncbi:FAD-dependent monooxygenase [Streptomyces sp. NPDC046985]|uniref:FAD-dependent monooxygenase n=1 Tax=Streptomyces sp. NPDC046985 TaxID=3155377 RepID=UPI0033C9DCDE
MTDALRTRVAITGGGLVGLMLALFLDRYGIESVVFNIEDSWHNRPRGATHNARTMEHYRRLGISGRIRHLGLPADHALDTAYFTRYSGFELSRLHLQSSGERMRALATAPRTDHTPEPTHRANQMYAERFLYEHSRTRPAITLRFGWRVTRLKQNAGGVTLQAESVDGRARETWQAPYAVGCDGGRSFVRRSLGVRDERSGAAAHHILGRRAVAAQLRLPTFHTKVVAGQRAFSYWAVNPELVMNLTTLNGHDEFHLLADSADPSTTDAAELTALVRRAAGMDLPVEVLSHRPWTSDAATVAERLTIGRVFLAGDAAHPFPPNGEFGMNTGVDDVANLAWKLAGTLQGWGGAALLGSYESERQPIARRNAAAARELATRLADIERPDQMEADSPEGVRARDRAGALLRAYGERTHSIGLQLGARYDQSPLIDSHEEPPTDSLGTYTPTAIPGGRAPHVWLDRWRGPGSAIFDRFGAYYTLLRLGPEPPSTEGLEATAAAHGMPLQVIHFEDPDIRELYGRDLVLVRPDQHIAWRGNNLPASPHDLVARVTGRLPAGAACGGEVA